MYIHSYINIICFSAIYNFSSVCFFVTFFMYFFILLNKKRKEQVKYKKYSSLYVHYNIHFLFHSFFKCFSFPSSFFLFLKKRGSTFLLAYLYGYRRGCEGGWAINQCLLEFFITLFFNWMNKKIRKEFKLMEFKVIAQFKLLTIKKS